MNDDRTPRPGILPALTIAFGITVAMWAIGYACRMPGMPVVPPWLLMTLLLACPLAGGFTLGRRARLGATWGAAAGAASAILNLLVLGSFVAGDGPNELRPSALIWIPGSLAVGAILAGAGAAIGAGAAGRGPRAEPRTAAPNWVAAFAAVAVVATLLVVVAGGLVTGWEAGQAVPDWPTSFGSNMFLYPFARMTGGIYYEHAHRLYGSLVGVTTITLAAVIWAADARGWMRAIAVAMVLAVILQGVVGGLWVNASVEGGVPMPVEERPVLVVIGHGAFAQVFFAAMCLIGVFSTRAWRDARPRPDLAGGADRALTAALLAAVLLQLLLGAAYRHSFTVETPLPWPALGHIVFAVVVTIAAGAAGIRAWSRLTAPPLPRLGRTLLAAVAIQIVLGLSALFAVLARTAEATPIEVALTTAHQANGALILAAAAMLAAWTRRLIPRV